MPTHGVDQALFVIDIQLLAQITDINFNDIALTAEIISPYAIEDHIASQYLAGMT
jgi:hypothetical protein